MSFPIRLALHRNAHQGESMTLSMFYVLSPCLHDCECSGMDTTMILRIVCDCVINSEAIFIVFVANVFFLIYFFFNQIKTTCMHLKSTQE